MLKKAASAFAIVTALTMTDAQSEEASFRIEPDTFKVVGGYFGYYELCGLKDSFSDSTVKNRLAEFCKTADDIDKIYDAAKEICEHDDAVRKAETDLKSAQEDWDYNKQSAERSKNYDLDRECASKALNVFEEDVVGAFATTFPTGLKLSISAP